MKKTLSLMAAGALAAGGLAVGLAGPAAAQPAAPETITASGCDEVDYKVTVGTTVVLTYGGDCVLLAPYVAESGSPTIVQPRVGGYALLWHQAVGRASADATCEAGWAPSYAEWMNDGKGGYTCERVIDWGIFEGMIESVSITVNTDVDFAWSTVEQSYVFGCGDKQGEYDWDVFDTCKDK